MLQRLLRCNSKLCVEDKHLAQKVLKEHVHALLLRREHHRRVADYVAEVAPRFGKRIRVRHNHVLAIRVLAEKAVDLTFWSGMTDNLRRRHSKHVADLANLLRFVFAVKQWLT